MAQLEKVFFLSNCKLIQSLILFHVKTGHINYFKGLVLLEQYTVYSMLQYFKVYAKKNN